MKECTERIVRVGFRRSPKVIVDEIEQVSATMIREGWSLKEVTIEDSLEKAHLFFERNLPRNSETI